MAESRQALDLLISTDVLLVNLQEMRGERTSAFIRAVLTARRKDQPTLVIAASPADLLFLGDSAFHPDITVLPIGDEPIVPRVRVVLVGRERPQLEREFEVTLRQLRGESQMHDRLVRLGLAAWWAANQSLVDHPEADHSIRRFLAAIERQTVTDAATVADFNAFRGLLLRTLCHKGRIEERLVAVEGLVEHHLNTSSGQISIVVRQRASAKALAEHIAARVGCDSSELPEWGVHIRTGRRLPAGDPSSLVIASGFSGFSSIDAVLASHAPEAALVIDPVEAALAVTSARRTAQWLVRAGVPAEAVNALAAAAEPVAVRGDTSLLTFVFDVFQPIAPPRAASLSEHDQAEKQRLLISFVDGDCIVAEVSKRFDVVDPVLGKSRTVAASSLSPGDEIVLTDDTALFSERLIASLDEGILREEASRRRMWVTTVEVLVKTQNLKKSEIHRQLALAGVKVDYQTVRAWTTPTEDDDRVPDRWEHFRSLAEVVGFALPESELRSLFDAVRTLRVRHRKAGRDLVRMMRAARAGRLDPFSLSRVQSIFGVGVRELVEATRVTVVDDVQPED
jgi:hypothetical protein